MLSSVLPFRKKIDSGEWRSDELAECYRIVGLLARSGLPVSIDSGLTDEGEPWAIILREDTGDVLLHMARLNQSFVVVSAAGPIAQRGESLRAVLDTAVRTGGLAMLTRHSAAADSEILRLHPATLIAAFIVAAWVHTETSQAELLQASARGEHGVISRTDDARLTGFAVPPPSAALATAAASFVFVAVALAVAQADPALEVTSEDFIQAALELLVTMTPEAPATASPVKFPPVEFANLELQQDAGGASSTMMSDLVPQEALTGSADTNQRFETVVASTPLHGPAAINILTFFAQQQNSTTSLELPWDADIRHALALDLGRTVEFTSTEEPEPLVASAPLTTEQAALAGRLTAEILTSIRAPLVVIPSPVLDGEDLAGATAKLSVHVDASGLRLAHSVDPMNLIFESAARILHMDRGTNSTDFKVERQASAMPATQAASQSQTAPIDSDIGGSSQLLIAAGPPPPPSPSNAELLLQFTTGTEHVVRVDWSGLTASLPRTLDTGDARKVVIFDAPWLQVKSFMLMPGVMMMEDGLMGGVNRAGMEMKGSPVSLDLGGGLSLTLLGVLDLGLT